MEWTLLSCLTELKDSCLFEVDLSCLDEDFEDDDEVAADADLARTLWALFGAFPVLGDLQPMHMEYYK